MTIVERAKGVILRPKAEWPIIDAEPSSVASLYTQYLIPLALIGAVARLIGMSVIGISVPFIGRIRVPITSGLTSAVFGLAMLLIGVYVWAIIINALAPTFNGRRDMTSALKLAIYAGTPVLAAGILSILPSLFIVQVIAAIYSLYVLYLGFPVLMKVANDRAVGYTAATIVSGIVLGVVIGGVSAVLGLGRYGSGAGNVASDVAAQQAGQAIAAGVLGAAAGGSAESRAAAAALVSGAVAAGQQAEAAQRAAVQSPPDAANPAGADPAAAGAAAAAAVGAMVSGGKATVDPVSFQTLKDALPASAGGFARSDASGEKTSAGGFAVSSAQGTYTAPAGGNVTVKISDLANASGMLAMARLAFSLESESSGGFEKNIVLGGQKVHEKWTASGKSSELDGFVGDRFMIEVRGSGVDIGAAEKAFASVDFGKLRATR